MRTYGRVTDTLSGVTTWVEVDPTNGHNDPIWITTLIQCLKLQPGESPFYSDFGIPAQQSVLQQIAPDLYVARLQTQFSQYFASLIIARQPSPGPTPIYRINILTNSGVRLDHTIAV